MARDSRIEWTDHTFNPWWGCTKVSPACLNCYAEAWAKRTGQRVWGKNSERRFFTGKHWQAPVRWNRDAKEDGVRRRVFCASMADVFEERTDLVEWRYKLWQLIDETPYLDWLLLTKRPESVRRLVPWAAEWPTNVWLGTTVEEQKLVTKRLQALCECPASVLFLSCEPLLGRLDLSNWLDRIGWVIAGGESGSGARPMDPAWARSLRDQCLKAGVAFHFKQWGAWYPAPGEPKRVADTGLSAIPMLRGSKKRAGRLLDGRTWDQLPAPAFEDGRHLRLA